MKHVVNILIFLNCIVLQPFFASAQTVHLHEGKIEYKDTEKVAGSKEDLYNLAKEVLNSTVKTSGNEKLKEDHDSGELKTKGYIRLESPYSIIKTVHYT